jgi:DNA-binding XRE family transcriptional regulator
MKVNVDLIVRMRKDNAWSQEELALAAGLNLRTIQRVEKEAVASLQTMKALASAFKVNIRDLEYEEYVMLNELVGKEVLIDMGLSFSKLTGSDSLKGKILAMQDSWLKLAHKKEIIYVNISHIRRISPQ